MPDVQIDRQKHAKVKYLLDLAGSSFSDIAASLSLSPSTISSVSLGRSRSRRVEKAISERIGVPESELWPERITEKSEDAA
ncbi:helix-turn-helix domain-containing protein [uncultured Tateyamaria sp.]|uniref:helix-turn-helix domain-containing protein n=1 Tax=uncultured Tateyamaria sp. TaxID=455651 RepID=UPI0026340B11|nr:helix-turn-helix domain-containing protein [uncultured Tateyamaria sp.]